MKYLLIFFIVIGVTTLAKAQQNETHAPNDTLAAVEVDLSTLSGTNTHHYRTDTLPGAGSPTINGLLRNIPEVDLRGGPITGFADLSIRGGSFNRSAVFINGIMLGNPQTGHHLLQLPIDPTAVHQVSIHEGSIGNAGFENTYTGAINLTTRLNGKSDLLIEGGQYGLLHATMNLRISHKPHTSLLWSHYFIRSNGYPTEKNIHNTGLMSYGQFGVYNKQINHRFQLFVQGGWQNKKFGAYRLYSPFYPWQYERLHNGHLGLKLSHKAQWTTVFLLSANLLKDRFELFREDRYTFDGTYYIHQTDTAAYAPGIYYRGANIHLSADYAAGFSTNGTLHLSKKTLLELTFKATRRFQVIYGNKLGVLHRDSIYLAQEKMWLNRSALRITDLWTLGAKKNIGKNLRLQGSFSMLRYGNRFYSFGGIALHKNLLQNHIKWLLRAGSAFRLPTFTELYYQGPSNKGNPMLEPERNWELETGLKAHAKAFQWKLGMFFRYEKASIDWIRYPSDSYWHAENLCPRTITGFRLYVHQNFGTKWLESLSLNYQYLTAQQPSVRFDSKYVLDFLRHYAQIQIVQKPFKGWTLIWNTEFKSRQGKYAIPNPQGQGLVYKAYKPYLLLNIDIDYRINSTISLFVHGTNLNNSRAYDLAFVPIPGRWVTAGLRLFYD